MTVTTSNEPEFRQRASAFGGRRGGWLAVLLLSAMLGCAGLDNTAPRLATRDGDTPRTPSQRLVNRPTAAQAAIRRLPTPLATELTARDHDADDGQVPFSVDRASFQDAVGQETTDEGPLPTPAEPGTPNPYATTDQTDWSDETDWSDQTEWFPIDLPTTLRLAGANNLHIALAAERVEQARAAAQASQAKWLPSLNAGVSYNKHDGRIQSTDGKVIEANRGSLFVGGGVGLGGAPLNGGSGGPPRLFVDMSVADLLFAPLAARQMVDAAAANESAVFNQKVLDAALAYQRLVHARTLQAIRQEAVEHTTRLVDITSSFARAGEGYPADEQRARAELARRQGEFLEASEAVDDASTALALVLRLDPATRLDPTDQEVVPLDLVDQNQQLESLIVRAVEVRPDLESAQMLVGASSTKAELEHWRPWLPHLYAGYTGGGFGGNDNSDLKAFGDRGDFDVAAVWQLENFGMGNAARRRTSESQHRQAHLEAERLRDQIVAEVTTAFNRARSRRRQIDAAVPQIKAASRSLELNFTGIRGGVLRPIEPQQAIGALIDARASYLNALIRYNVSQFQLLHAIGLPPYLLADSGSAEYEAVPPPVDF